MKTLLSTILLFTVMSFVSFPVLAAGKDGKNPTKEIPNSKETKPHHGRLPKHGLPHLEEAQIMDMRSIGCEEVEVECICDGALSATFGPATTTFEDERCVDMQYYMMLFYGVPGVTHGLVNNPEWSCSELWDVFYQPAYAAGCKLEVRCTKNCTP